MKKKIRIIAIVFAATFFLYAILLTVLPVAFLRGTVQRHYDYEDASAPLGFTEHFLSTEDGETVAVYETVPEDPDAVIIYLSGMTGPSVTAFANFARALAEQSFGAVLLETRGHGASTGDRIGLGYLETEDVRAAVKWCLEEKKLSLEVPLILCGVSMGASASLVALGELPELDGAICWSPYVSFEEQFELEAKTYLCPPLSRKYATRLVKRYLTKTYGEEATNRLTPRSAAERIGEKPVLICASEQDRSVSVENTRRLETVLKNVTVCTRPSSDHLVAEGNRLENAASDATLLGWVLNWLNKEFREVVVPAA